MHTRLIPALAVALAIAATLLVTNRGSSSGPAAPQGATIPLVAPSPALPALDPKLAAVLYYPSAAHAFSADQLIALYQQAARPHLSGSACRCVHREGAPDLTPPST